MLDHIFSTIVAGVIGYHISFNNTADILAQKEFSLADRYPVESVNHVFAENIKLTLAYMAGVQKHDNPVDWEKVDKSYVYTFILQPGQTFAFHDDVLPQYVGKITKTTDAHFNAQEGYLSDGWLTGDGVCHFASFINVVAKQAGLDVNAPTRHDFANIPDVPKELGVSIYATPGENTGDEMQNLYITNNKSKPVAFVFSQKDNKLDVKITEVN